MGVCAAALLPPPPPLLLPLPLQPLAKRFFFFFLACRIRHIDEDGHPRLRKLVSVAAGAATSPHPAGPGLYCSELLPASFSSQASRESVAAASLTGGGCLSARCPGWLRELGASRG